jgi:hypothetical protein
LIVVLLQPSARRDDVYKSIAGGGAHLVSDLQSFEVSNFCDLQFFARHDTRGFSHFLDLRDRHEPSFVVASHKGLARIGSEIDLARHHLLHGQIPRWDGEFFELEPALLQCARSEKIISGHPPDISLKPLADGGGLGKESFRPENSGCHEAAAGKD